MSGHADIIRRYLDLPGDPYETPSELADAESALDALVAENQQQTEALHRCRDDYHTKVKALVAEHQQQGHKVAAYDAARAKVKIEGNTRAYYVLRAEKAEAEIQQLRDALQSCVNYIETDCEGSGFDGVPASARAALAGKPSEDTE